MAILYSVFPDKQIDGEAYWELLKDLSDKPFIEAVTEICRSLTEIYPGTNLVAMLRKRTIEIAKNSMERLPALPEAHEMSTPPKEWNELVEKLKNKGVV